MDEVSKAIGAVPVVPGDAARQAQALLRSNRPLLQGRSVLWVDDHPENNAYESNLLRQVGVHVHAVRTTSDAQAFLHGHSCDLVISDVHRVEQGEERPVAH